MPKVYVYVDPDWGIMLRNREIAVKGDEIPIDQIDPEKLEKLLDAKRVKIEVKKAVKKEEPKAPVKADSGTKKGGRK